jgi:hypothetical protein
MRNLSLIIVLVGLTVFAHAQTNTHTGQGAGNAGWSNSFYGYYSGTNNTAGANVGVGAYAAYSNTSGSRIVAVGYSALYKNTFGSDNTALGYFALRENADGGNNVGVGSYALGKNTMGFNNTAIGRSALYRNVSGGDNTALGSYASFSNYDGFENTAIGRDASYKNISGYRNVAVGFKALRENTASGNVAVGVEAMHYNVNGASNTAIGSEALQYNTDGNNNTAVGRKAANSTEEGGFNTALGGFSLGYNQDGNFNTGIGYATSAYAGSTVIIDYSTALGAYARNTASAQIRIGDSGINSIGGYQSWTNVSDGRFKRKVKEDVLGLEFINALRPVSYDLDLAAIDAFLGIERTEEQSYVSNRTTHQTGFIAQEVEAAAKKLGFEQFSGVDAPQNDNDHYGLRYAEFVVPLVKSVQELSAQNEALKEQLAQQQAQIEQLLAAQQLSTEAPNLTSDKAQLYQNIPNPHQGQTAIKVFIPETSSQAFLQVTDLSGKQLKVVVLDAQGEQVVQLHTRELEAGMYLYTLVVDQEIIATKKMVVAQ